MNRDEPAAVTAESLIALFDHHRIIPEKSTHRGPSRRGFSSLAGVVEQLRRVHSAEHQEVWAEAQKTAADLFLALKTVRAPLLAMIKNHTDWISELQQLRRQIQFADLANMIDVCKADLQALHTLRLGVVAVVQRQSSLLGPLSIRVPRNKRRTKRGPTALWHNYAVELFFALNEAMQTTNKPNKSGYAVSPVPDGPAGRFLGAVIPIISGESPSPGTVADYVRAALKRLRNSQPES